MRAMEDKQWHASLFPPSELHAGVTAKAVPVYNSDSGEVALAFLLFFHSFVLYRVFKKKIL